MIGETLRGRLVVATPSLTEPNFSRTVIFMLDHNDEGGLGVVLNRPSTVDVATALPGWDALATAPPKMFVGGPVQPEAVVALAASTMETAALQPVGGGIAVVDLRADAALVAANVVGVRLFAGYAGWGGGQLEDEIEAGGWFVIDGQPQDVFTTDPEGLWVGVLERQGGLFTTITENPSLN